MRTPVLRLCASPCESLINHPGEAIGGFIPHESCAKRNPHSFELDPHYMPAPRCTYTSWEIVVPKIVQ